MKIGYARVSTLDQNLDLQISALKAAGCEKIFEDKISGTIRERPGLNLLFEVLREGDVLVVWKLDRLGRSIKGLLELTSYLEKSKVLFKSLTDNIDTTTPSGRFYFHIMASLAQMDREIIVERTKAGLVAAKARGRLGGRKRKMTDSKLQLAKKLLSEGVYYKEVAENLGLSVPTLYRHIPGSY